MTYCWSHRQIACKLKISASVVSKWRCVVVYWIWPPEQRWYAHLRTIQVHKWKEEILVLNSNSNPLNWLLTRTTQWQMPPKLWMSAFPRWQDRSNNCVISVREKHQKPPDNSGINRYAVRYLSYMVSATVLQEQEASPQWQPREAIRWGAGLLTDLWKSWGWSVACSRLTSTGMAVMNMLLSLTILNGSSPWQNQIKCGVETWRISGQINDEDTSQSYLTCSQESPWDGQCRSHRTADYAGAGLLAHVVTGKYADHMPLPDDNHTLAALR